MGKPRHLICGFGEVGSALSKVLSKRFEVFVKDIGPAEVPTDIETMHICLPYYEMGHDRFVEVVKGYLMAYNPRFLDICSTVRPGTTRLFSPAACHSTTRGLHPNLKDGLLSIAKHVGGVTATELARQYAKVGVRCVVHRKPETTELCHLLNNTHYGYNLMFADDAYNLCRYYGVDYFEYMKYTDTHNQGFRNLDHERLVRPVLTPPYGRVGGHCVVQGAALVPEELRSETMARLATYNEEKRDRKCVRDLSGVRLEERTEGRTEAGGADRTGDAKDAESTQVQEGAEVKDT